MFIKPHKTKLAATLAATLLSTAYLCNTSEAKYLDRLFYMADNNRLRNHELQPVTPNPWPYFPWNKADGDGREGGSIEYSINIPKVLAILNDPHRSDFSKYYQIAMEETSTLDIFNYPKYRNGTITNFGGVVWVRKGDLTLESNDYVRSPLLYLDNANLYLRNNSNAAPGNAFLLDLDIVKAQAKKLSGFLKFLSGTLKRMEGDQLRGNTSINIEGGLLIQGMDAHRNQLNMSSGHLFMILQEANGSGNVIKKTDKITGGTINNVLGILDIQGGKANDYLDFGTLQILDLLSITGITNIGTAQEAAFIDWNNNALVQNSLNIAAKSGFKTGNISNISTNIYNDGLLTIYKGSAVNNPYVSNSNIYGKGTTHISTDMENRGVIEQNELLLASSATLSNINKSSSNPATITVGNFVNGKQIILRDGFKMFTNDFKGGDIGQITLDNGSYFKVNSSQDLSGTFNIRGNNTNTLNISPNYEFLGTINIGTSDSKIAALKLESGNFNKSTINLLANSKLEIANTVNFVMSQQLDYQGTVILSGGNVLYLDSTQTDTSKFYGNSGSLTIGADNSPIVFKLQDDSYIKDALKLDIKSRATLAINTKGAVTINTATDSWAGTILLKQGQLNIKGDELISGNLIAQDGMLSIDPKAQLTLNDSELIARDVAITSDDVGAVLNIKGGSLTLNTTGHGADKYYGSLYMDSGNINLTGRYNMFTDSRIIYQQTGGDLNLSEAARLRLNKGSQLNGGSVVINGGSLEILNGTTNSTMITTMPYKVNYIELGNISPETEKTILNLAAGSNIGRGSGVNIYQDGILSIKENALFELNPASRWNGTIELSGVGTMRVMVDTKEHNGSLVMDGGKLELQHSFVTNAQDRITGGNISIKEGAILDNQYNIAAGINNSGSIVGKGTLNINAKSYNLGKAEIDQDTININSVFHILNKTDDVVSARQMTINTDGKLYSQANSLNIKNNGSLTNNGEFIIQGGTLDYAVVGNGKITIDQAATFADDVNQSKLNVQETLTIKTGAKINIADQTVNTYSIINNSTLTTPLNNYGTITGSGQLVLSGNSYNGMSATIDQDSLIVSSGKFENRNTAANAISANTISIQTNGELTTKADAINIKGSDQALYNAGILGITSGTINYAIKNLNNSLGTLSIRGNTTLLQGNSVENNIEVSRGQELIVQSADDLKHGARRNFGTITLGSGTIATSVIFDNSDPTSTYGKVVIDGDVLNQGNINQHVTIKQNSQLISDIGGLGASIRNDGELLLSGSRATIKDFNSISGGGSLQISGNMSNYANIEQNNITLIDKTYLANEGKITAQNKLLIQENTQLANTGTINAVLNNKGTISDSKGVMNLRGHSVSSGTITQQQVNIAKDATLENSGSIEAALDAKGKITGSGQIRLSGDSTISADVSNKITNVDKTLTVSGSAISIDGAIKNSGTIYLKPSDVGITITGGIDTADGLATGTVNIASAGKVKLDSHINKQTINLSMGTLQLGSNSDLQGSSLKLSDTGKLDLVSADFGKMHTVTLKDFTVGKSTHDSGLMLDVDLQNSTSDKLLVTGTASSVDGGKLKLNANIVKGLSTDSPKTTITVVDTDSGSIDADFTIDKSKTASDSGIYEFVQNATNKGQVDVSIVGAGMTLGQAIADASITSYSMSAKDYLGSLGTLQGSGRALTIFGNNHTISGQNNTKGNLGISVANAQELIIKNATISNFKNTDAANNYMGAIANEGTVRLENITFRGNTTALNMSLDILNNGQLYIQSGKTTMDGGIKGNGSVYIADAMLDMSNGILEQKNLTIGSYGSLSVLADFLRIQGGVNNDGALILNSQGNGFSTLNNNVNGSGYTLINGKILVASNTKIDQNILVGKDSLLSANTDNFTKNIYNDGTIELGKVSSTNSKSISEQQTISGSGTLDIYDRFTNNGTIEQNNLVVQDNVSFSNNGNGQIIVGQQLLNKGTLLNNARITAALDNKSTISGDGYLQIVGNSANQGTISQTVINIIDGIFENKNTAANSIQATNSENIISISADAAFITNADAVGSNIKNDGIYQLSGGTINYKLEGAGNLLIDSTGTVTNNTDINQNIVAINKGTFTNTNDKKINAQVIISSNGTLNARAEDISQDVYNNGIYNISGTVINKNILALVGDGVGRLNISSSITNQADILQGIVSVTGSTLNNEGRIQANIQIDTTSTLSSNAGTILGVVSNQGVYEVLGGTIAHNIEGSGKLNIQDDTYNKAMIQQSSVNIAKDKVFASNAGGIQSLVDNQGTYQLLGGTISHDINGNGQLVALENTTTNKAQIKQSLLYIAAKGGLENTATITATDGVVNLGTLANKGIIEAALNNQGIISGQGKLLLSGHSINDTSGQLTQGQIELASKYQLENLGKIRADLLTVNKDSVLISNADNMSATVLNNGYYVVTGGMISYEIRDDQSSPNGFLSITGNANNRASVRQQSISVDESSSFSNDGNIVALGVFQNDGSFTNTGSLSGSTKNNKDIINRGVMSVDMSNDGQILGSGSLYLHGISDNSGTITQGYIDIAKDGALLNMSTLADSINANLIKVHDGGTLQANADTIKATIDNDGIYHVQGGTIKGNIRGQGLLNIWADTTNNAYITQDTVNINDSVTLINNVGNTINSKIIFVEAADPDNSASTAATLRANAGDINAIIKNDGLYIVSAGTIKQSIFGAGNLQILGQAGNQSTVEQSSIAIATTAGLDNAGVIITDKLSNQGVFNNSGVVNTLLNNDGSIGGSGYLALIGDHISKNISNGTLKQGTIELNKGAQLDNNALLQANLLVVNTDGILNSTAANMQSNVLNDGTYNMGAGNVGGNISGKGMLNIGQNIVNPHQISQNIINIAQDVTVQNANFLGTPEVANLYTMYAMSSMDKLSGGEISKKMSAAVTALMQTSTTIDPLLQAFLTNKGNTITNLGTLNNNGLVMGAIENKGNISGQGTLLLFGQSHNTVTTKISQTMIGIRSFSDFVNDNEYFAALRAGLIEIDSNGSLSSNAYAVSAMVLNNGRYDIIGSKDKPNVIYYDIVGNGKLTIAADRDVIVVNDSYIQQSAVDVNSGEFYNNEGNKISADVQVKNNADNSPAILTANASDIDGMVSNFGIYNIQGLYGGGVINKGIFAQVAKNTTDADGFNILFGHYKDADGSLKPIKDSYKEDATNKKTYSKVEFDNRIITYEQDTVSGLYTFTDSDSQLLYGAALSAEDFDKALAALLPTDFEYTPEYVYKGELNIKASTLNNSIIGQDQVNVAANVALTNNGSLLANRLTNNGAIINNSVIEAQLANYGLIKGSGSILAQGDSLTLGDIYNNIVLDKQAVLTTQGNAVIYGNIVNDLGDKIVLNGNSSGVIVLGDISSATTLPANMTVNEAGKASDRVIIAGNVTNQDISVFSGTLGVVNSPKFKKVNLHLLQGATLSTQDQFTSSLDLNTLSVEQGSVSGLDLDLGDTLNINNFSSSLSGHLSLGSVMIDSKKTYTDRVLLFTDKTVIVANQAKTYTNNSLYTISQSLTDQQYLEVSKSALPTDQKNNILNLAIGDLNNGDQRITVQISGEMLQDRHVNPLVESGKTLVIAGDMLDAAADKLIGKSPSGERVNGLSISTDSTVIIKNLQAVSGFATDAGSRLDGGFIDNYGSLHIISDYLDIRNTISHNYARNYGGSIANHVADSIYGENISFSDNIAGIGGGAVANYVNTRDHAKTELYYTEFQNNKAGYDALGDINTAQIGKGGAYYNYTADDSAFKLSAVSDLRDNLFANNISSGLGGAIYNATGDTATGYALIRVDNSIFKNNIASGGAQGTGLGGAIYHAGQSVIWSDNSISAEDIIQDIRTNPTPTKFQLGTIQISNTEFIGNIAANSGGAIYSATDGPITLKDTSFVNNIAQSGQGGAIYSKGSTVNITASTVNVDISGNRAGGVSNAIYLDNTNGTALFNLEAKNSKQILIADGIVASGITATLNLNTDTDSDGIIVLGHNYKLTNADGKYLQAVYSLGHGKLYVANESNFSGDGNNELTMAGNTALDSRNKSIGTIALSKLYTTGTTPYINLGVDMGNNAVDQLLIANKDGIATGTVFNINTIDLSLVADTLKNSYGKLADFGTNAQYALDGSLNGKVFSGKIYDRKLTLTDTTLNYEAVRFNSSILASSVALQGTYLSQLSAYDQAFDNYDGLASSSADERAQLTRGDHTKENYLWFKPYTNREDMYLNTGLRANNTANGGFLGVDFPLQRRANGWDVMYSLYAGFNALDNSYENVKLKQNGINIGATAGFFKGNFFTLLTANIGYNNGTAEAMFGSEKFKTTAFGLAAKTGYNIKSGNLTIQPNLQIAYTNLGVCNYTNAAGIPITSGRTNAWQIAPGLKIAANLANGWKPYVSVQKIWSHGGASDFMAADVLLTSMKATSYYQYDLGVQKNYGDKFSGDAKIAFRNGGRQGIAFQANLRWKF